MNQGTSSPVGCHVDRQPDRCAAAHVEDSRPCDGPADAVRILDHAGEQTTGCVRHGAALLASLVDGRVYPGSVDGAAVEAHRLAGTLRPFEFLNGTADAAARPDPMRQQPEQQQQWAWPPVEQDDTSDDLHEHAWWRTAAEAPAPAEVAQALDVFGAVPTGPGVWHGHTNARQCVDIRDTADPAVVRDALRAAVDAGMVSPAEAVELWPAGGAPAPAAELDGGDPPGPTSDGDGAGRGPSPRGLAFADWLMEAEGDALVDAGVDVETVIEAARRWEHELLPDLLGRITGRTDDTTRTAVAVDECDDADGW